jgi:hypothetical protein
MRKKREHPIVQVAVYDGVESVNKIIELRPPSGFCAASTTPRSIY